MEKEKDSPVSRGLSLAEEGGKSITKHTTNNTMSEASGCGAVYGCWTWRRLAADGRLHPTTFMIHDRGNSWESREYPNQGICPSVIVQKVPVMRGEGGDADR